MTNMKIHLILLNTKKMQIKTIIYQLTAVRVASQVTKAGKDVQKV